MSVGIQVDLTDSEPVTISFNTGTLDADSILWVCTGLEGWETPEPRQTFVNKTGDHGVMLAESYVDRRALILQGVIQVPFLVSDSATDARYWAAWNKLTKTVTYDIVGGATFTTLTVHESPTARYAMVKLTGRPKFKISPKYWEFELPLVAPDPHKYLVGGGGPPTDPGIF